MAALMARMYTGNAYSTNCQSATVRSTTTMLTADRRYGSGYSARGRR
jgi:hypothetical protein